jgi:hypothetical protein
LRIVAGFKEVAEGEFDDRAFADPLAERKVAKAFGDFGIKRMRNRRDLDASRRWRRFGGVVRNDSRLS